MRFYDITKEPVVDVNLHRLKGIIPDTFIGDSQPPIFGLDELWHQWHPWLQIYTYLYVVLAYGSQSDITGVFTQ